MPVGRDIHSYRAVGTPAETGKRYYGSGHLYDSSLTTPVANTLYATPLLGGRGYTIDEVGFYCSAVGTASKVRLGLYAVTLSPVDLYPTSLVVDFGEIALTTGWKSFTGLSQALAADAIVMAAYLTDGASSTVTGTGIDNDWQVWGYAYNGTANYTRATGLTVSQTYGALPATFPAGATIQSTGSVPILLVSFSA